MAFDGDNKMTIRLVSDEKIAGTSSKGNQEKWFDRSTNRWYKLDQFGYETLSETLISNGIEASVKSPVAREDFHEGVVEHNANRRILIQSV